MANVMQENNAIFVAKSAIVDKNELWMLSNDADVLLHFDFVNMKLSNYYILPGEKLLQYSHLVMAKNGNSIYIAPYMGDMLFLFDSLSGEIKNIAIPYDASEAEQKNKFNIAVVWKSQLVLVGHAIKGIFYYDMISGGFVRDTKYLDMIKKVQYDISGFLFGDCYYQKENKLYIPLFCRNMILEIDLDKHINKIHELKYDTEIKLCTIDGYEQDGREKFLLTTKNDEMLIWSPVNGVEKMKDLGLLCGEEKVYMRAFHMNEKNYYIAAYERRVFVEIGDEIRELNFEYENKGGVKEAAGGTQFEAIFKNGTDIYFQARSNGQLFKIDTVTDAIYQIDFDIVPEKRREIIEQICISRPMVDILIENMWMDVNVFLKKYICEGKK